MELGESMSLQMGKVSPSWSDLLPVIVFLLLFTLSTGRGTEEFLGCLGHSFRVTNGDGNMKYLKCNVHAL